VVRTAPHRVETAELDCAWTALPRRRCARTGGERHAVTGRYAEIEPERRLVFSWHWVSMPERVSRVTVALRPVPEARR
jgi:uncharacterized protein YndB with AHSA1/START domain